MLLIALITYQDGRGVILQRNTYSLTSTVPAENVATRPTMMLALELERAESFVTEMAVLDRVIRHPYHRTLTVLRKRFSPPIKPQEILAPQHHVPQGNARDYRVRAEVVPIVGEVGSHSVEHVPQLNPID